MPVYVSHVYVYMRANMCMSCVCMRICVCVIICVHIQLEAQPDDSDITSVQAVKGYVLLSRPSGLTLSLTLTLTLIMALTVQALYQQIERKTTNRCSLNSKP